MIRKLLGKPAGTYRRLLQIAKQYWLFFLFGILGTLVLSASDALFAWLIKPIINLGFINRDTAFITLLPFIIVLLFLMRGVAGFCSTYFIGAVARSVVRDFRRLIFNKLLQLPTRFYDQSQSGKLLSTIIYNVEQVATASSDVLTDFLREGSLILGLVAVMLSINWQLSLIFFMAAPAIAWLLQKSSVRLRKLSKTVQHAMGEVTHVASEVIDAYRIVRLYGGQTYEKQKFEKVIHENRQRELKIYVTNGIATAIIQLLIALGIGGIIVLATRHLINVTAGSFAALVSAMIMLLRPMRRINNMNNNIQKGLAGAESIFALLDQPAEQDKGKKIVNRVRGYIEYCNVSFHYDDKNLPTIEQVSFVVKPKQTVAIVGHSGSGKSTLMSLLPRFYEVNDGQILLDGQDLRDYSLTSLRQQFALVAQQPMLFNDTVAHNIAYGAIDAIDDQSRIIQAAKQAHAWEFIEKLPAGLQTYIGENGLLLSGGQRQRIAIAAALFRQAPILILDEATSALDSRTEQKIQHALNQLIQQCTTLVIAHRLSTIKNADHIIVLEKGRVVEQGNHTDLLKADGSYALLYHSQFNKPIE